MKQNARNGYWNLRAFVDRVVVGPEAIHIRGRKNILSAATAKGKVDPEARVPTFFLPEWRAGQDKSEDSWAASIRLG
ncbi:MAG: hypothetical protein ACT4QA_21555 [Panacagrimonas sp.]